jgi:hypothetical protein
MFHLGEQRVSIPSLRLDTNSAPRGRSANIDALIDNVKDELPATQRLRYRCEISALPVVRPTGAELHSLAARSRGLVRTLATYRRGMLFGYGRGRDLTLALPEGAADQHHVIGPGATRDGDLLPVR